MSSSPSELFAQPGVNISGSIHEVRGDIVGRDKISIGMLPSEQIRLVEVFSQQIAVSSEARAKAEARAAELGAQLGFTQQAMIGFFRIVGERDVPPEQIPLKLGEIAARHRDLMDRWSILDTADPATVTLAVEAKSAIDAGRYDGADELLLRAREQEVAAARQAEQLAHDAQLAAERRWLRAAEAAGKRGDLAMTRLRYADAAEHYAAAAGDVPETHQELRQHYQRQKVLALSSDARQRFIEEYRSSGRIDPVLLERGIPALVQLAASSTGAFQAQALLELGTAQRLLARWQDAATSLERSAYIAGRTGESEVTFDAMIGVARVHMHGSGDYHAASRAFERATDIAGDAPSPKQLLALLSYGAQLHAMRGEIGAQLVDTLFALQQATGAEDRFYAELDVADTLQKLAEGCDPRPLIDAKSAEGGDDLYGACRRAVAAAHAFYGRACETAAVLGWTALAHEMQGFQRLLAVRLQLIEMGARTARLVSTDVFCPQAPDDVLASRDFQPLAGELPPWLSKADARNPDIGTLRATVHDIKSGEASAARRDLADVARQLEAERRSSFNPSRRGTIINNYTQTVEPLALRLLALGDEATAFGLFESVRARGLGEVAGLANRCVSHADRTWLSRLLAARARENELRTRIVGALIASSGQEPQTEALTLLGATRAVTRRLIRNDGGAAERLARSTPLQPDLDALATATESAGIPVLLYWSTNGGIVAWLVAPGKIDVRNVFIPGPVLTEKVNAVMRSAALPDALFDERAARELFLVLLSPFQTTLDQADCILVVPHGPLASLPFEALIDPVSGTPATERWAFSYAPNAMFATAALGRAAVPLQRVMVVQSRPGASGPEIAGIETTGLALDRQPAIDASALAGRLGDEAALHVVADGRLNSAEPLCSILEFGRDEAEWRIAADLIALPIRSLRVAVLSAYDSAIPGPPISNEMFGFPWAFLAAGAQATVMPRWRATTQSKANWLHRFYATMREGLSPPQAAAEAARTLRREGFAHPHHWALMQVTGG